MVEGASGSTMQAGQTGSAAGVTTTASPIHTGARTSEEPLSKLDECSESLEECKDHSYKYAQPVMKTLHNQPWSALFRLLIAMREAYKRMR